MVLGMDIGPSEAETFWTAFLRKLARRALRGVKLVISDAHEGIKAAASKVLCATWRRCRVHFLRSALAHAGRSGRRVVAAFIATGVPMAPAPWGGPLPSPRTSRRPPGASGALRGLLAASPLEIGSRASWPLMVADQLRPTLPKLAVLMDEAEADVLAYMTFPAAHRTKLHSVNPLERLNSLPLT
jgi:transposase-like protein